MLILRPIARAAACRARLWRHRSAGGTAVAMLFLGGVNLLRFIPLAACV
jgi:cell division protein FtsW